MRRKARRRQGPARRHLGQGRRRRRAVRRPARLRPHRGGEGRPVPLRRRRRHLEARQRRRAIRQRAWYYSTLTVDPPNPDVVWCPQVPLLKSIDGGKTFQRVKGPHHGDHHDLWIDPKNPQRMIDSNDGGVDIIDQRRRDLVRAAAADRPVLSHQRRQPRALPRHRHHAGHRHRLRAEQQPVEGRHRAGRLARRRRRRDRLHRPRPDRSEHRLRRRVRRLHLALRPPHPPGPQHQHLSVQPLRPRPAKTEVSLPVDRPDPDFAARSRRRLPRRQRPLPHHATAARPGRRSAPT